MKQLKTPQEAKAFRNTLDGVGFVPTMGALHSGHVSLIQASQKQNKHTVVSIFLNPTQFNNSQDLLHYPADLQQDLEILSQLEVDAVFLPKEKNMYPDGYHYKIIEDDFSKSLCGHTRPGHFDGVLTVVLKLFQIIKPDRAYFGEKDFQQLKLIENMVKAFFLDVEIVACPIIRDGDGLALSSRNKRLTPAGLEKAKDFAQKLKMITKIEDLRSQLSRDGLDVDYLQDHFGRRFAAVHIENVRLIDNVPL